MGGSRTVQKNEVPRYIEEAGQYALERSKQIDALGRLPFMGPEVAAVNPHEAALAKSVGSMASAFGLEAPAALDMGGMQAVTQGGLTGYSSYPSYISSMERLRETRPDQYEYFAKMTGFDPITGARIEQPAPTMPTYAPAVSGAQDSSGADNFMPVMTRPRLSSRLDTKGQIGKYATPPSGSFLDKLKSDISAARGQVKSDFGGLFSGLRGR